MPKVDFIQPTACLETYSEDLQTVTKDKMNWGDEAHRQEQKKNVALGNAWWYKDWTRWLYHGSFGKSLKNIFNIPLSSSQQDGYSLSKFKDNIYPTLKKWSFHACSVLCLPHVLNIWADCKHWIGLATVFTLRNPQAPRYMSFKCTLQPLLIDSLWVG